MIRHKQNSILLSIVSAVLGGILGWGIQKLLDNGSNDVKIWFFILTVISCLITCLVVLIYGTAFVRFGAKKHAEMADLAQATNKLLEDSLKHKAEVIPRDSVYPELTKCLRKAQCQVAVVTYYMYDWENNERTFLPPEQDVSGLEDFYEAIYECIESPTVEYIRIWQVPEERLIQAREIIERNKLHKKEIDLIRKISLVHPDLARFVIASEHTTASFILVDKRHLFFNIDFYDKARNVWLSPYMILIKDATEGAFAGLNSIIVRLTNKMIND